MARILVIEDNAVNLRLAKFVLESAGHTVFDAGDAEDGLQRARAEGPDLVLMDIQLPGMDGLEATRRLKADPRTRGVKVIAVTAFAMKGDEQKMLAAGCDGYLAKPYPYEALLARVDAALGRAPAGNPGTLAPAPGG